MQSRARSFYLAALFLPSALRHDVRLVYTFCRMVDDLADDPPLGMTRSQIIETLEGWEQDLLGRDVADPLMVDMQRIIREYAVSPAYFLMLLDGARMDLTLTHIATLEELGTYSILVAGSVGMILAQMMGARHPTALAAARDLGVAMQMTNVLRDVVEDLDRGRIYLPRQTLSVAGCTTVLLLERRPSPQVRAAMREVVDEARLRYRRGRAGIEFLNPETRLSVAIAAGLYEQILEKIERSDYDVFSRRVHLGMLEKWMAALPLCLRYRFGG
jgi:phytoene synthase